MWGEDSDGIGASSSSIFHLMTMKMRVDTGYRFHSICSSTTCVETAKWKALAMTPGSGWHLMSSALREWEHVCVQREERNERLSEREQVLEWLMADSMNGQRWIFLIKGMNFCFVSAVNNERPQHSTPSSQAPEHLMNLFQTSFSPPAANLEPLKTTEPSGNMGTICCVSAHSSLWKMRPNAARQAGNRDNGRKGNLPLLNFCTSALSRLNVDFLHTVGRKLIILSEKLQLLCFLLLVQQALKLL